jgi:cytochrome b561
MVRTEYTATAKWLHWVVAALMIVTFYIGWVMVDMHGISPTKLKYFNWHKWVGMIVLGLAVVRSVWRLLFTPPPLPNSITPIQRVASHAMHYLLYLLCFAVPISGYFYTLAAGYPVVLFGVLPLPVLMDPNVDLKEPLRELHEILSYLTAVAVVLHTLAALQHHFIHRDTVLRRMLPRLPRA